MSELAWSVSPALLVQLGDEISASAGRFLASLETLTETIEPLIAVNLDESGEGTTGLAMKNAKDQWTTAATNLQVILSNIGTVTKELSDGYSAADTRTTSMMGQYGII